MKVYNKITIDIATGETICEEAYLYYGIAAHCKGGKTTSTVTKEVDYAYNRRMAAVAERQQNIAEGAYRFWQKQYAPTEAAQQRAIRELLPGETALRKSELELGQEQIEAERGLLPEEVGLRRETIGAQRELIPKLQESLDVDIEGKVAQARSDVSQQFGVAREELGRQVSPFRRGEAVQDLTTEEAKSRIQAIQGARRIGEETQFARLTTAAQLLGDR